MTRKNKSSSFNMEDAYEARLLAWAELEEHGDYSKYVKRLIGRDMDGWERRSEATHVNIPAVVEPVNDFSGFI